MNVRMAKESKSLWQSDHSGNTLENCLHEGRTESESKIARGAEPSYATNEHNACEGSFFLVVCLKKY
jgi:hypothetical protein